MSATPTASCRQQPPAATNARAPAAISGVVFDIQRFSVDDGPGIRTTVFLKGCPLSCRWCHNPESRSPRPQVGRNRNACTDCGACVDACPAQARLWDADGRVAFDGAACVNCGACVAVCAAGASQWKGAVRSAAEVLDEVLRDRAYYQRSGGGLTLSGGEPLQQFEFALALLRGAKAAGLHTCVETCGVAAGERYDALRPFVDLWLLDIKGGDPATHRANTGVDPAPILDNLARLVAAGARVRLRCPLVPGVNDSDVDLAHIAALSRQYAQLEGVEIMPYHALAVSKAEALGQTFELAALPSADATQISAWRQRLTALGVVGLR